MDDIAHDLETFHATDDVEKKTNALSNQKDRLSATKNETSEEIAVDDDDDDLSPSLKDDENLETPRVNVVVNHVEISQGDDRDDDDESFRYVMTRIFYEFADVGFWNERKGILRKMKAFFVETFIAK